MRLDPNFLTHTSKGEHFMIATSETKFTGIVRSNETAAFILECLKTDTTEGEIADRLMAEYSGADRKTVENDIANIIRKLRTIGAILD